MAISFTGKREPVVRFFNIIYKLIRALYHKPAIFGLERIRRKAPSIYVANHLGSYGPVAIMSFFPFQLYPWVTHEVTEKRKCAEYIEKEFVYKELGLKPPMSRVLSSCIGDICVSLMKHLEVIPVYKKQRRISHSIDLSARYLAQGKDLLIFPEISDWVLNDLICKFDSGFVNIARLHFERHKEPVSFYPVAVSRERRSIRLGNSIDFNPHRSFIGEKRRIVKELEERVCAMIWGR